MHRCTLVPGDKFRQTVQLVSCEAIVLGIGIWGEKDGTLVQKIWGGWCIG